MLLWNIDIDSIDYALNDNFSIMGANISTIKMQGENTSRAKYERQPKKKYNEAMNLKIDLISITSISYRATGSATVNYLSKETTKYYILELMRIFVSGYK